jgi:hypothetical protein
MVSKKNCAAIREKSAPESLAAIRVRTIEELIASPPDDSSIDSKDGCSAVAAVRAVGAGRR